ncbi:MAG: hypothetical protein KC441_04595 [Anaerolineales bacterium]|nr:hypothetical protein [Anaerolineales bacterium]
MNLAYRTILPLAGLIILLVFSLALNYFLVKRYRQAYREWSRVTLDPLALEQPPALPDNGANGRLVLFYGDSRAAAWPEPADSEGFVFVNGGVNGQTAVQMNLRYAAAAAPLQPDIVVVQVGINDLRVIPALPDQKEAIIAATADNIRQIVSQATAGGATVIVTTIFPVQTPPWTEQMFWSDEVRGGITAVNHAIQSLAGENVLVLDTYALLADEQGVLRSEFAADYLHINANGYYELNQLLRAYLLQLA